MSNTIVPADRQVDVVDWDTLVNATHAGQANWATSPDHTCADCAFWDKDGRCGKFQQLMHQRGARVPARARACRYIETKAAQ